MSDTQPGMARWGWAALAAAAAVAATAQLAGNGAGPDTPGRPADGSGATLVLELRGQEGKPVSGALVRCAPEADESSPATTRSDAAGVARCAPLPPGRVAVTVEHRGWARSDSQLTLQRGERRRRVVLSPAARLEGVVVDDRGEPIADAELIARALAQPPPAPWTLRSGAEGRFAFETMPPGAFELDVTAVGHERTLLPRVEAPSGEPVRVTLGRTAGLSAQVLDTAGAAAMGASVLVAGSGIWPPRRTSTDESGRASFPDLPAGVYELRASAEGMASPPAEGLVLEVGGQLEVTLQLEPGATLLGQVVDATGAAPIADAEVLVAEDSLSASPHAVKSDADGRFSVAGLRRIEHRVSVRAPGYVAVTGQPRVPGEAVHRFALERAASVAGRVVDEAGEPVAGVELEVAGSTQVGAPVSLSPAAVRFRAALFASQLEGDLPIRSGDTLGVTRGPVPRIPLSDTALSHVADEGSPAAQAMGFHTDGDGAFHITGVPPGSVHLIARRAGFAPTRSERLDLSPGQSREDVQLTLRAGGTIEGRVVDAREFPVESVRVELHTSDDPLPRVGLSDGGGGFIFEGVRGACTVRAHAQGQAPVDATVSVDARERAEVTLVLGGEASTLQGRVFGSEGFPVEGAAIRVTSGGPSPVRRSTLSAADGTFRIGGLPAPPYSLRVDHPDFAPTSLAEVEPGQEPVSVVLAAGVRYAGRVLDDHHEEPLSGARLILRGPALVLPRQVSTDGHGQFEFRNLPAGNYELAVRHTGFVSASLERALPGPRGEAGDTEIRLTPAGGVSGEVVDRLGQPVAGARVAAGEPADWRHGVRTGPDGAFVLAGLEPGEHVVSARHPSAGESLGGARARVYSLQQTPGLVLRLPDIAEEAAAAAPPPPPAAEPRADADAGANAAPTAHLKGNGVAITLENQGSDVIVSAVRPASAAARAGVRVGDHLRAVDGEPVLTASQGRGMLRGPAGSELTLELMRGPVIKRARLPRETL